MGLQARKMYLLWPKSYSGLSLLLILAGDVELCPGPNVKCVSCNKTIRKKAQKRAVFAKVDAILSA